MTNVAALLLHGAARAGDGPALRYGDLSTTYPRLVDRVARLAGGLAELGLRPGDRVVLDLPNSPDLVELMWACFWGGHVVVPVNWHLHRDEVAFVVEDCAAAAVLVAPRTAEHARGLPASVQVLSTDGAVGVALATLRSAMPSPMHVGPADEPAWLFYTSGTTGRPKGATLSHRNLMAMTLNYYADLDQIPAGSVYLHAAPLSHGSGLYLLPATGHGATNVIAEPTRFDPDAYLDLLSETRATHAAFLAPTMLNRLLDVLSPDDTRTATLRSVVVGGAPFYREDASRALNRLGPVVHQIYGQGESPMTITVLRAEQCDDERFTSCGRPYTGVLVRVVDPAGTPLPAGEDGEVVVRGDVVMSGYWGDPDASATAVRDGWLHTGDIGRLDEAGFLHLTDRAKDVIITGGSNVYPREVEEVLLTHPGVVEVAVVGRPDRAWGESICAVVVAAPGTRPREDELVAHCRARLAAFKKPRTVMFVAELPKNAAGKVLRRELRELAVRDATAGAGAPAHAGAAP